MPTYEYECQKCGHTFERFQSMTADRIKRCPKCRGKVNRLFGTGAGILFKGSGFYETDYRSESYRKGAKKETGSGESGSGSGKTADKKTDQASSSKATKSEKPAAKSTNAKED